MKLSAKELYRAAECCAKFGEWKKDPIEVFSEVPLSDEKSDFIRKRLCDLLWPGMRETWRLKEWHFWMKNNPSHLGSRLKALAEQVQGGRV